jgi:hypothetical protein
VATQGQTGNLDNGASLGIILEVSHAAPGLLRFARNDDTVLFFNDFNQATLEEVDGKWFSLFRTIKYPPIRIKGIDRSCPVVRSIPASVYIPSGSRTNSTNVRATP